MRITRSTLHKIAKDTVAQRVKTDHNVMAALLVGSTLFEDPFIGHTTDIDIVFVCFNDEVHPKTRIDKKAKMKKKDTHFLVIAYSFP